MRLKITIGEWDALNLVAISDNSIDRIVTDPPWGIYTSQETNALDKLYAGILLEFSRILKDGGIVVILMGQKELFEKIAGDIPQMTLMDKYDILVSGKKAAIYKIKKQRDLATTGKENIMIDVNELRKGTTLELDNKIYQVLEYHHHKPGRGNAVIRTKLRDLRALAAIEKTFLSGDRVQEIRIESRPMQYLYKDDFYHFMDTETYDQIALSAGQVAEAANFLREGQLVVIQLYETEALSLELPTSVELEVIDVEPGVKGDTATGARKLVTLETGYRLQVPLFVKNRDRVRIDTRSGQYLEKN